MTANVGCVKCGLTGLPTIGHEPCPGPRVIYTSWGYDQTNVEFYQIVRETKASVWMRPIQGKIWEGRLYPLPNEWATDRKNSPDGQPFGPRRKKTGWKGELAVNIDAGNGYIRHGWLYNMTEDAGCHDTYASGQPGH